MNPDRFARMSELVLKSAELGEEERRAFLDRECQGDPELRAEVESMLAHDGVRMERSGVPGAQPGPARDRMNPTKMAGRAFSHYHILNKLGEGGMGEVYLAQDERLEREVALKILRAGTLGNDAARRRFRKEALALSKLNHPNIATVFDFDTQDGVDFLVMEYVAGETLSEKLGAGPMPEREIVSLGVQLAEGLAAAHERGIIHRDLKPGNLRLTPDGRLKILDFGLAKLAHPTTDTAATESMTEPHVMLGTLPYMSPEQVLGRPLDKRSDIFSLGVVLYEMCTGKPAFSTSKRGNIPDAIIHSEPEPISHFSYEISEELERIIRKAMAKLPEERYRDGGEFLVDLRALRRRREFQEYVEAHPSPQRGTSRRIPARVYWIALPVVAAGLLLWFLAWRGRESPLPRFAPTQVTSTDAWEGEPAISPDGGRVAYASNAGGNPDIYITSVRGGGTLRLTDDPAYDAFPDWFPDGAALAFSSDRSGQISIWKVGQLGGGATLLVPNASQPAVSPDGSRIAFTRWDAGGSSRIGVASLADPAQVTMLTDEKGGYWNHEHSAWSPDGRRICYATRHGLWIVPSSGGTARRLTTEPDLDLDPTWSPSGRQVYFCSYRDGTVALWRTIVRGGKLERITLGTSRECQPSLSRDGGRLAYATQIVTRNLVIQSLETREETVLRDLPDAYQAAFSPDERQLVFVSLGVRKELALWIQPLDEGRPSGPPRQLTDHDGNASHPAFSPDGRWIAYQRIIGEERDIWVVPARGGQSARFTDDPAADMHPAWSPDGSALAFASEREEGSHLWVAPIRDGLAAGPARRIAREDVQAFAPAWSPDGTLIAFQGVDADGPEAWVVPADGRTPARKVTSGAGITRVRWERGKGDLYVSGTWGGQRFTLRRVSLDGSLAATPQPPVDLGPEISPPTFDVSADGRLVVFPREETKGDIWVLESQGGRF
jgi:eukaryotic-like serine/threonine-protein kinase